jgi:HlyD family secretion protein
MKNGQPRNVPVETGISSDTYMEIISGVSEGDVVVTAVVNLTTTSRTNTSPFGIGGSPNRAVFRN